MVRVEVGNGAEVLRDRDALGSSRTLGRRTRSVPLRAPVMVGSGDVVEVVESAKKSMRMGLVVFILREGCPRARA